MSDYTFPSLQGDGHILVFGLGETGLAAARWCLRHAAPLRVADTRAQPAAAAELSAEPGSDAIDWRLGDAASAPDVLDGVRSIVLSPGLSPLEEPVSGLLERAGQAGIEVIGEIELFARALADMAGQGYAPKVLAVTGTNGKTTVTAMTRQLLETSGFSATAAGNISPAALAALAHALESDSLPQVWVLELSSFQLETTRSLKPDAAAVLNLTQDHLDWHGSMQAYGAAKARLLPMADIRIVNRDDAAVRAMVEDMGTLDVRSFGGDLPERVGDCGLETSGDVMWLCQAQSEDFDVPAAPSRRRKAAEKPQRPQGRNVRLMPVDALYVRGVHNALNAQAALLLGRAVDAGLAHMLRALRDYQGEPHRMEFVRSIGGVDFVNDSKGTNVGATVAALQGAETPVVLIAGGLGKAQDFEPLGRAIRAHAKAVVLIGRDARQIAAVLGDSVPAVHAETMGDAVRQAHALAQEGDMVLLSPACASMDMFRSYVHRGESFVDEVRELALERGEAA